jgi:hypothetical protein
MERKDRSWRSARLHSCHNVLGFDSNGAVLMGSGLSEKNKEEE